MQHEPGRESSRTYRAAFHVGRVLAVVLPLAGLAGIGYGVWLLIAGGGPSRTLTAPAPTPATSSWTGPASKTAPPAPAPATPSLEDAASQAPAPAPSPVAPSSSKAAAWSFDPVRLTSPGDPDWSQWCQAYFSVSGNTMTVIVDRMSQSVTDATVIASLHGQGVKQRHVTSFTSDMGSASFAHGRAAESLSVVAYAHQTPHVCRVGKWTG